jgi:hypothetical protein
MLIFRNKFIDALECLVDVEEKWKIPQVSEFLNEISVKYSPFSYEKFEDFLIHKPEKFESNEFLPNHLKEESLAMFFSYEFYLLISLSWVCYEHRPRWMWNKVFNADHDKRLIGYDDWHIVNEIHIQKYQINFHCLFAMSKKYGTVICAVRGTEFNTSKLFSCLFNR